MTFFEDVFRSIAVWKVPQARSEDIRKADAIVTAAHGLLRDGTPSPGDKILAEAMLRVHRRFPKKPMVPQEPVAMAAGDLRYAAVARPPKGNALGSSNLAWNSRAVARFQAKVCRNLFPKKKRVTVALIATPWCQPRMKWELERCGLRVVVVPVPLFHAKTYNHPLSIYWYGRGKEWRYLLVEATRGRAHYLSYWLLRD